MIDALRKSDPKLQNLFNTFGDGAYLAHPVRTGFSLLQHDVVAANLLAAGRLLESRHGFFDSSIVFPWQTIGSQR
jgi:hypothetical protein